jgi:hypothetical protein
MASDLVSLPTAPRATPETPGRYGTKLCGTLVLGIASNNSLERTVRLVTLWTSTVGALPEIVIVSSSAPTRSWAFTVAVNDAGSSMPSCLRVAKPGNVKVTL